jgi:hypothetical protein
MKLASMIVAASAALLSGAMASAAPLTQKDFELFAEARFGPADGKVRYWYRTGPVRDVQTGETIYTFEYYDAVRHVVDPKNPNKRYGIVRKLDLFRDKDTNAVLETLNGQPVKLWEFPYQLLELEYKDGQVSLTVTQGAGQFLRTHKFPKSDIERHGNFAHITFPGFYVTRRAELPDHVSANSATSLFIICEKDCKGTRYHWNQVSVGPLAPWAGGDGKKLGLSSTSGARYETYAELPEQVRRVIEEKYPDFREPVKTLEEVRALQR